GTIRPGTGPPTGCPDRARRAQRRARRTVRGAEERGASALRIVDLAGRNRRGLGIRQLDLAVQPGCAPELPRLVDALPREVVVDASEVAVRGRLLVDRPAQVEVA